MKNLLYKILFVIIAFLYISCETKEQRFTGSPENRLIFENVNATVSTTNTFALPTQEIDFTATLPADFRSKVSGNVTVEATTTNINGSIRKANVDIKSGQNSATGKIVVGGGGGAFTGTYNLKLTAITLENPIIGKHFTLSSNELSIAFGPTTIPDEDGSRLLVRVVWENKVNLNQLNCYVKVPSGNEFLCETTTSSGSGSFREYSIDKIQRIQFGGIPSPQNVKYAFESGDYIFSINASLLETSPNDLNYRIIVRFPDGIVKVFNGVYPALTLTSGKKQILKFSKTGLGELSVYDNFIN